MMPISNEDRVAQLSLVSRALKWLLNFSICTSNLGFVNTWKIMLLGRVSHKQRSIAGSRLPARVYFRGRSDLSVMSHLFSESACIQDTSGRPVRSIIDCGANIGIETLKFRLWYPKATIIALEPDFDNFALLQRNTAFLDRVIVKRAGVWSRNAVLRVRAGDSHQESTVHEDLGTVGDIPGVAVEAVTLDGLLDDYKWPDVDILKIDIEGAELELFQNSAQWIHRVNAIIIEAHDAKRRGSTAELFSAARDFDAFIHGEHHVLIRRGLAWKLAPRFRVA
jgi:FkbM family methyltransferase